MSFARLRISSEDISPGYGFNVLFNPEKYTLTKGVQLAEIAIPGLDSPLIQFVRGQSEKITMELFCDTTKHGMVEGVKDVRAETSKIYQLVKVLPEKHAPPRCELSWGGKLFSFGWDGETRCVVESLSEEFVLFSPQGTPLRAKLNVTFREYKSLKNLLEEKPKHSPDRPKVRTVERGQTLSHIAGNEYGDPGEWRRLADANNLSHPRRLPPGMRLEVPPIRREGALMAQRALPFWIRNGPDCYVPSFLITLSNREELEVMNDTMTVTYSDSLTAVDSVDLTINNWDAEALKFKYSDAPLLNPWTHIDVEMGYYSDGKADRRVMLKGEITTLTPNFPASGASTLTVRALNLFHRFRTKSDTRCFRKQKDTQIAETLLVDINKELRTRGANVELKLDADEVKANLAREQEVEFLVMSNQTPIEFLMMRAKRLGYELTMVEDLEQRKVIFHFGPSHRVLDPTYELEWGTSLVSFQPSLRTADQVAKVTVRGWDSQGKKKIEHTATRAALSGKGPIHPSELGVTEPNLAQAVVVDLPVASASEAKELAEQILRERAVELITAKGRTIGLPDLRAGAKLKIEKLGRFSGTYLVTESTHTMGDGGYTTDFSARMEGGLVSA